MNARSKALLVLLLASLGAFAAGQSPTQTVLAFAKAVSQRDAKAASALVDGGKQNTALPLEMPKISVSLANISETVTGTSSIVSYRITITGQGRVPKPQSESINLVQRNGKWLVVPWSAGQSQSRYLASIAYMLSAPGAMRDTEESARMTACLSNLKQIAVAALMLANDFGDNFKFSASNFKVKLTPYLKKPVWHCPSSAGVGITIPRIRRSLESRSRLLSIPQRRCSSTKARTASSLSRTPEGPPWLSWTGM